MKLATDFLRGKYLSKDDYALEPKRYEIAGHDEANLAMPGEPTEVKAILHLVGETRPMVLNATNLKRLIKAFGPDMDAWVGSWVELFCDAEVTFGAEMTGGLRLRAVPAPKKAAAAPVKKGAKKSGDPVQELAEMSDDAPWETGRE